MIYANSRQNSFVFLRKPLVNISAQKKYYMKRILLLLVLFCSMSVFSQDMNFLQSQNGFRDIKLGNNINDYDFFEKKSESNKEYFGAYGSYYEYIYYGKRYDKIGDAKIFKIFINTYNDLISQIEIVTAKDYNLWKSIENAYGPPTVSREDMNGWYPGKIGCRISRYLDYYYIYYENVELYTLAIKKRLEEEKDKARKQF